MILATYQPIIDDNRKSKWDELESYLGYKPIFCFSANNAQDAIVNSVLAAPNCPEKLIIFETDDYVELDIVQYNRKAAINIYGYFQAKPFGCNIFRYRHIFLLWNPK